MTLTLYIPDESSVADVFTMIDWPEVPTLRVVGVKERAVSFGEVVSTDRLGATVIVKAGSDIEPAALEAVMIMLPTVPAVVGVPVKAPVVVLSVSHDGKMVPVLAKPVALADDGAKLYAVPTVTVVVGEPEIVGGAGGPGGSAKLNRYRLMMMSAESVSVDTILRFLFMVCPLLMVALR